MSYFYDLPDPKDSFLVPEIAERMARVASRMEEDALTSEVIRVLRGKGYTVTPPGEVVPPSPADAAPTPPECDPERVETVARAMWAVHHGDTRWEASNASERLWYREIAAAAIAAGSSPAEEAVKRVEALAESWRYKGEFGWGPWQEGYGPGPEDSILDRAAAELRAALASPAPAPQGESS